MLIKPELIKRSLGLRVSLPLTSLTAVSVRHLRRLINKKSSFQAVKKMLINLRDMTSQWWQPARKKKKT